MSLRGPIHGPHGSHDGASRSLSHLAPPPTLPVKFAWIVQYDWRDGTTTFSVAGNATSDEATEKARSHRGGETCSKLAADCTQDTSLQWVIGVRGSRQRTDSVLLHSSWHRAGEGHAWIRVGLPVPRRRQRRRPPGVNALVRRNLSFASSAETVHGTEAFTGSGPVGLHQSGPRPRPGSRSSGRRPSSRLRFESRSDHAPREHPLATPPAKGER